jgi:hypothetical protein
MRISQVPKNAHPDRPGRVGTAVASPVRV